MGILSVVNRYLLSNSKSQFKYLSSSSNLWFIRRNSSPAVHDSAGLSKAQSPHACDLKSNNNKLMFLIEYFYNISGKNNNEYPWDRSGGPYNYSLISAEKSWKDHHNFCNPFSGLGNCELAGSCNELMLLFFSDKISLWNPTINEIIKILPESDVQHPHPGSTSTTTILESTTTTAYGFGFDPESEDYKVLIFIVFNYADGSDSFLGPNYVELYSLKTNSWKKIKCPFLGAPFQKPSIHVNGVYYWGAFLDTPVTILSFDFAKEKFSHVLLPPELEERFRGFYTLEYEDDYDFVLVEFDGSLAALVHSKLGNTEKPFSVEVWGWNGESWRERISGITIDVPGGVVEVVGLFQDDKLLLQGFNKGELMLFDIAIRKLENLGIHANPKDVEIFPYVGSSLSVPRNRK